MIALYTGFSDIQNRRHRFFRILALLWLMAGIALFPADTAYASKAKKPSFSKTSLTVNTGRSVTLNLNNNHNSVYWRVSDKTVLSLDKKRREGVRITGLKKGTADVTAQIQGTDIVLSCRVKVVKKPRIAVVDIPSVNKAGNAAGVAGVLRRYGADASVIRSANFDVNRYDGLVIPGGIDINPATYHEKRSSRVKMFSSKLDQVQLSAVRSFVNAKKPILGICRGLQLINVYFGGTLKQHISGHGGGRHRLKTVSGSMLFKLYGSSITVPTGHHQCVKKLGSGLKITQRAAGDDTVEAVEHETLPIVAVQWHPELSGGSGAKLFKAFILMCGNK